MSSKSVWPSFTLKFYVSIFSIYWDSAQCVIRARSLPVYRNDYGCIRVQIAFKSDLNFYEQSNGVHKVKLSNLHVKRFLKTQDENHAEIILYKILILKLGKIRQDYVNFKYLNKFQFVLRFSPEKLIP